jgi:dihydroxyacetone kinase DhaKLM complex PTS-EIIA-like component DhaM
MILLRVCVSMLFVVSTATAQNEVAALVRKLGAKSPAERLGAANELAALGPKAAEAAGALEARLADAEVSVAEAAGRALGKIGQSAHARIKKALLASRTAASAMVAVEALGAAGAELVPEVLEVFAKDLTDPRLEPNAKKAIQAIGAPAVSHLIAGLKARGHAHAAATFLGALKETAVPAIPALTELATDKSQLDGARSRAMSALDEIGDAARVAVPKLLQVALDKTEDDSMRINAIGAITFIGTDDPAIKAALKTLANDKRPEIAARAKTALQVLK